MAFSSDKNIYALALAPVIVQITPINMNLTSTKFNCMACGYPQPTVTFVGTTCTYEDTPGKIMAMSIL